MPALLKTVLCTSFGTFSFGALAHFMLENALKDIPLLQDTSSYTKNILTYSLSTCAAIMFALSKSLESYQFFAKNRHFKSAPLIATHHASMQCGLFTSHKFFGNAYLIFVLCGYFHVNLHLLDNLGANSTFSAKSSPYFLLAACFALSSTFIERVFSYKNMMLLSQRFFAPPSLQPLLTSSQPPDSQLAVQIEEITPETEALNRNPA